MLKISHNRVFGWTLTCWLSVVFVLSSQPLSLRAIADDSQSPRPAEGDSSTQPLELLPPQSSNSALPPRRPMFGAEQGQLAFEDEDEKAEVAEEQADNQDDQKEPFEEDPDLAEKREKAQQAVKQLFRGLQRMLGPNRRNRIQPVEGEEEEAVETPAKDADAGASKMPEPIDEIDALAPYDASLQKIHYRIQGHLEQQQWNEALELIEQILHSSTSRRNIWGSGTPMIFREQGQRVLLIDEINRLIGQLPEQQRLRYARAHEADAESRLAEAIADNDVLKLANVAQMYLHTPAGLQAINRLGSLHLDRGEFGLAALMFLKLVEKNHSSLTDPVWAFKAALVCRKAGFDQQSDQILQRFASGQGEADIEIGGESLNVSDWIALAKQTTSPAETPVLDDWPLMYGSTQRTGTAAGGLPLLLPEWSNPMTFSASVREQANRIRGDLIDLDRAPIPAMTPLLVGGKVIYRTLRGISVVNVDNGQLLWETADKVSAEIMMTGQATATNDGENSSTVRQRPSISPYEGGETEKHPLANLMYRNGVYGTLTSDSEQVFVLEEHAIMSRQPLGQYRRQSSSHQDPFHRDWGSNRIVAYGLETGRQNWSVGGTKIEETFEPPLTGYCFLGTPVPDGDELYVVGEKDKSIELICLDRETGQLLWSQLLAYSDAEIEWDFGRRWWNTQVSAGNGVLVCPTSIGWLVGIDRLKRSVLWMYRYTEPTKSADDQKVAQRNQVVSASGLNTHWSPSAPVVVGNHIVYTPAESPFEVCLNLYTGEEVWKQPKNRDLYLAGVFDGRVVVVGKESVIARAVEDGRELWRCRWGSAGDDSQPAGMGIAVDDQYYLPLSQGEMLVIDLEKGGVVSRAALPAGHRLGNLAMHRGLLVSLDTTDVTGFRQRDMVLQEIQKRKVDDPHDPLALLNEADILQSDGRFSDALASLNSIEISRLTTDQQTNYHRAMLASLIGTVRNDLDSGDVPLSKLKELVRTPQERLEYNRLVIEGQRHRGEHQQAFTTLWQYASETEAGFLVSRTEDARISVNKNDWLSGELSSTWGQLTQAEREAVNPLIAETVDAAFAADANRTADLLRMLRFHPDYWRWNGELVSGYAKTGEYLHAESRLLRQSHQKDPGVAADGLSQLVQLMLTAGWQQDARFYLAKLRDFEADTKLADGTTVGDRLKSLAANVADESSPPKWKFSDYKVEQTGAGYMGRRVQELDIEDHGLPFWKDHRFEVLTGSDESINMLDARTDAVEWRLPLRTDDSRNSGGMVSSAKVTGHQLIVSQQGTVYAMSPTDKKVSWKHAIDAAPSESNNSFLRRRMSISAYGSDASDTLFLHGSRLRPQHNVMKAEKHGDSLYVVNNDYVCFSRDRELIVLDVVTGELRWKYDHFPQQAIVLGTEDFVVVVPKGQQEIQVYRAQDGRLTDIPDIKQTLQQCIAVLPAGFLLIDETTGNRPENAGKRLTRVRLYSPGIDDDLWSKTFDPRTAFSLQGERRLLSLHPQAGLASINLETGYEQGFTLKTSQSFGDDQHDAELSKSIFEWKQLFTSVSQVHSLADDSLIYLIFNHSRISNYDVGNNSGFDTISINGTIIAFDRETGENVWQQPISKVSLVNQYLNYAPILLLTKQQFETVGDTRYPTTQIMAIDKKTGRVVVDENVPTTSGFQMMLLNMAEQYVELRTYNQRVRIQAIWKPFLERSI